MHKVGLLREIKASESRVMLTPEGVKVLVQNGVEVFVENNAGELSRFPDLLYERAGATILPTMEKVVQKAEILLHVSAPKPIEFEILNETHTIISFLNLLNTQQDRLQAILETSASFISAELIQDDQGNYPLLMAISEIAGRIAVFKAADLLTIADGGKGRLLSGTELIKAATITIVGAGKVGRTAAQIAALNGVNVNLLTLKPEKLDWLKGELPAVNSFAYCEEKLSELLPATDVLFVALYSLREKYDIHIPKEQVALMEEGSVLIDISIERAGIVETSKITTIEQPTYVWEGIVHYCVPNITALTPRTASRVLTKKLLSYLKILAQKGLQQTLIEAPGLLPAMSIYKGKITNRTYADHFNQEFYNIFELLELNL